MTRDNELIRQIILAIKARKDATPRALEIDGTDKAVVRRHWPANNVAKIAVLTEPQAGAAVAGFL
jgi:hypothetical protein